MEKKDVAIIGAGIAGIAAAVYTHRAGLSCVLFEKQIPGGQLGFIGNLDNYIGMVPGSTGADLNENLAETLKKLAITPVPREITGIEAGDEAMTVISSEGKSLFGTVIIATGARWKKLGVAGEDVFLGKGVSYCAVCDGFFFKNKDVCVIGGGNSAVEEALYLAKICRKVYLIHRRDSLRALDYLQKELFAAENIKVLFESRLDTISGEASVSKIEVKDNQGLVHSLSVGGVFIAIGMEPATSAFSSYLACDEKGFIRTDETMMTSQKGVFACGDCRKRPLRQLITAAGEGAVAAMTAYRYLRGNYISA